MSESQTVAVSGARLHRERNARNMSLLQLSQHTGIPFDLLREVEESKRKEMSQEQFYALRRTLRVKSSSLVALSEEEVDERRAEDDDDELLDCSLDKFLEKMREKYVDWDEFIAWTEERRTPHDDDRD